ncbi:MAG TPA: alpha-amylase family glycosyl hydrolase [Streptosporangiaceae bacterium]|nr:alpha-amylase family glycosyl hydrolase [Streptosporangiaceae bacterium]
MAERPWWHGAVLYQLYVRSWRDSNGDGYGDLGGIIEQLDHLAWLGVDGVWLSPTMPSPDQDWGYDVSDYTAVHPELGTLGDLDALVTAAAERGIRVLLDLVPNHTSSAHPWFLDAVSARDAEHRDYYVWADPARSGGPPNNWLDATGQPAWHWDAGTSQYYLHNFLPGQPDLNWWLPSVHAEFREILRFWFDHGIAGFRIDVAHGLYKDAELRDNPPLPPGSGTMDGRFGLRPVYNANRPETHSVYRDWRKIAESYSPPRLLLGETWVGDLDRLASYYGDDDELQLAFNFPAAFADFSEPGLATVVTDTLAALPPDACPVWTGSNHDIGRFPSRWCGGDERKTRLALLVLATLPGAVVLYYGDEIGMTDVDVPARLQRDLMTLGGENPQGNRDRARTPMRWDSSAGGGFSAAQPWLPIGPAAVNVADQVSDPGSVLWLCRRLLALRRAELAGSPACLERLPAPAGVFAYRTGQLQVVANLTADPVPIPEDFGELVLRTGPEQPVLGPWEGLIARLGVSGS